MKYTSRLVGVSFRPEHVSDIVLDLTEGDQLTLQREPDNPYDQWAIKVLFNNIHIGYVAAQRALNVASEIAPALEASTSYTCEVIKGGTPISPAIRIILNGASIPGAA